VRDAAREAAEKDGKPGYKFTLHAPSYMPVIAIRERSEAAGDDVPRERDAGLGIPARPSGQLAARLPHRRVASRASPRFLGYTSYAEVSLVPKDAESPQQVLAFLEISPSVRGVREKGCRELRDSRAASSAAKSRGVGLDTRRKTAREALCILRTGGEQYFPEENRRQGLFALPNALWREHQAGRSAALARGCALLRKFEMPRIARGQFYMDLLRARTKRGGA